MNFASAATEHPAFARELPRLSPKCDVCFRPTERDAEYRETDEDEFHYEPGLGSRACQAVRDDQGPPHRGYPQHLVSGSRFASRVA